MLHKLLREGHPRCLGEAARHRGLIEDLGKLWGHLKEGFGQLISLYCKLMTVKMDFHGRHPQFPGNLAVDKETLVKIGNNDAGAYYELCIEFLDYMDEILKLERGVFSSLDMSKSNSMTASGQCRLSPLIACIQDSVHLYDYTVKLLFLLHQHLPPDTLAGHTSRFLTQFSELRKFYLNSSNLQYFKHLVQVPSLPDQPPNFLVAAELHQHVTPVAVVPDLVEEQEDTASEAGTVLAVPGVADERERYIDQLLAEVEALQNRVTGLEAGRAGQEAARRQAEDRVRAEQSRQEELRGELASQQEQIAGLTVMLQEAQQLQSAHAVKDDKNKSLEEKFVKLKDIYQKLREEHIMLLRQKAEVDKRLSSSEISRDDALQNKQIMESRLEEVLTEISAMKDSVSSVESEQARQVHSLQAAQYATNTKLADCENELRVKTETVTVLEQRLAEQDTELAAALQRSSDAEQNRHNLEQELAERAAEAGQAEAARAGSEAVVAELTSQLTSTQHLLANKTTALAESEEGLADAAHRERSAALAMVESVQKVEDIESVTASCYSLLDTCTRLEAVDWDLVPSTAAQLAGLAWVLGRGAANTCPDLEHAASLTRATAGLAQQAAELLSAPSGSSERLLEAVAELRRAGQAVLQSLGAESDLADLVALEISAMDAAIEEASRKIEELLEASRKQDSGAKLEVNEAVLDSCTGLVCAIRELVNKSKQLQSEIMVERGAGLTDREFYKKNSRWTEGLISAAKAVGLGAKLLVDAADRWEASSLVLPNFWNLSITVLGTASRLLCCAEWCWAAGSLKRLWWRARRSQPAPPS